MTIPYTLHSLPALTPVLELTAALYIFPSGTPQQLSALHGQRRGTLSNHQPYVDREEELLSNHQPYMDREEELLSNHQASVTWTEKMLDKHKQSKSL